MGEQVGGVREVHALIWGFSSCSRKSGSLSSRRRTHSSSCSFQRFMPSFGGSRHVRTTFVTLGTCLSHRERICHIGNTFVVPLILEVHALLWGFSSHRECVCHVGCHPGRSRGSCPPMGVLFEFWEVQVVIAGECVCRVIRHPTRFVGFCPPVGVLFEFQEVRVVIVLSGTRSSCRSLSHSFRFVIWPSLSVSNA